MAKRAYVRVRTPREDGIRSAAVSGYNIVELEDYAQHCSLRSSTTLNDGRFNGKRYPYLSCCRMSDDDYQQSFEAQLITVDGNQIREIPGEAILLTECIGTVTRVLKRINLSRFVLR